MLPRLAVAPPPSPSAQAKPPLHRLISDPPNQNPGVTNSPPTPPNQPTRRCPKKPMAIPPNTENTAYLPPPHPPPPPRPPHLQAAPSPPPVPPAAPAPSAAGWLPGRTPRTGAPHPLAVAARSEHSPTERLGLRGSKGGFALLRQQEACPANPVKGRCALPCPAPTSLAVCCPLPCTGDGYTILCKFR